MLESLIDVFELTFTQIPAFEIRPIINHYILNKWQEEWDTCTNNKLHEIHLEISNRFLISFKTRFDQVVFTRCHIGLTRLTHACLLKGEDPTQCMFCKIPLSVKHILLDCPAFNVCRKLFYEVLLSIILPEKVLEFLSYVNVKNIV